MRKPKAIALFSGGLDSMLAVVVMQSHGVQVEAVKFVKPFSAGAVDLLSSDADSYPAPAQFNRPVKLLRNLTVR